MRFNTDLSLLIALALAGAVWAQQPAAAPPLAACGVHGDIESFAGRIIPKTWNSRQTANI
jgi:hypothetical protein